MNRRVIISAIALFLAALPAIAAPDQEGASAPATDANRIELSAESLRLPSVQSHQLRVSASKSGGFLSEATGRATFTSDDATIATVDAHGLITARAAGSTRVNATVDDHSASVSVTVI